MSLSNLIDSASTPGLSSFLSYNKQENGINTANDIQKQFYDKKCASVAVKSLKTKSDMKSYMTQSDITLFFSIFQNNEYDEYKQKVLEMMDCNNEKLQEIFDGNKNA